MGFVRFLSRVAFICNGCFLLVLVMLSRKALPHGSVLSLLFILGFLMAVFFNVLVNGCYLVLLLLRKPFRQQVPVWLMIANFLLLIPQIIFLVK
jgi:hypothetical protein